MTTQRTKQQTACDGIRAMWYSDTFTEILHRQVATQFSMDGVIPMEGGQATPARPRATPRAQVHKQREAVQAFGTFAANMDGVRLPWKKAYETA